MDSFTERMIEKAEQRNRALGLSNSAMAKNKPPMMDAKSPKTKSGSSSGVSSSKVQVIEKCAAAEVSSSSGVSSNSASSKMLRQFSAVDKENVDLGIEISIVSAKEFEVQVEVEEQDFTDNDEGAGQAQNTNIINQPLAKIRETSRNRLQRLGALYSNTDDLSSPIHRTEGQFHADMTDEANMENGSRRQKQKYGRLAALASTINEWEDDSNAPTPPRSLVPPPKPALPSRKPSTGNQQTNQYSDNDLSVENSGCAPNVSSGKTMSNDTKTKRLNWDPKVIDSLEAQGFQRRETSTVKLAYDYSKKNDDNEQDDENVEQIESTASRTLVSKLVKSTGGAKMPNNEQKGMDKNPSSVPVRSGLVSGRAAVFEQKASSNQPTQRPQKDPTELSLKERMQLFERNKGEALIPKAALGMAPSINQIRQDNANRKEESKVSSNALPNTTTNALVKPKADSNVRDKVAALVANATTISENKIRSDIQKQRQEDMQVLANRFNKQKEIFSKETEKETEPKTVPMKPTAKVQRTGMPPPPPPPPPLSLDMKDGKTSSPSCSKRRSPGDTIEDDESKRARKINPPPPSDRLYPALSDLESNLSESDNDNGGTTATVSPIAVRGVNSAQARQRVEIDEADEYDEENDSYMESEVMTEDGDDDDSTAGICNGSLGRDVMNAVVQRNSYQRQQKLQQQQQQQHSELKKNKKEVHYADKHEYIDGSVDSSINSSEGSMCVDDCIDEALEVDLNFTQSDDCDESDMGNSSRASRGSKGTAASNSFSFRKTPYKAHGTYRTISEENDDDDEPNGDHNGSYHKQTVSTANSSSAQPVTSNLTVDENDKNMVTLVHTVSFYRRQQTTNSANNTPLRKVCRELQDRGGSEEITHSMGNGASAQIHYASNDDYYYQQQQLGAHDNEETDSTDPEVDGEMQEHLVQEKIKKLLDEVFKQQQFIAQASQALNLCAATVEFSGSTESVEGERHLLVATHRRQACLDEVQRLRVEKSLRPHGAPKERGRLTIKEITVPLRQDYIRKLAADTISGHHLVCLLKYNEHVLATKTVPTLPGLLAVKFPDVLQLNNVYADFKVTLEIYGMTAQREVLPHEVKYHINLSKKSGIKTPKKKGHENVLVMPPVQSPAGPNVVRTPALVQYGFAIFSLREMQRTTWSLTQVLGVSPLDGVVHMKVQCELSIFVEYKGFLTMYEDISGFGAWHRRWCHLNGSVLNYWKYPDDEGKKTPMGSIDLYSCISPKISLAPRDICARLHTILLECQRPAKETDKESLIIVPNGQTTIVRYLLSADTKREREEWCAFFTKALALIRAWGPPN